MSVDFDVVFDNGATVEYRGAACFAGLQGWREHATTNVKRYEEYAKEREQNSYYSRQATLCRTIVDNTKISKIKSVVYHVRMICDKEIGRSFLKAVVSAPAFDKYFSLDEKENVVTASCTAPMNLMLAGLSLCRHCTEWTDRVSKWDILVSAGMDKHVAIILSTLYSRDGEREQHERGHTAIDSGVSVKTVLALKGLYGTRVKRKSFRSQKEKYSINDALSYNDGLGWSKLLGKELPHYFNKLLELIGDNSDSINEELVRLCTPRCGDRKEWIKRLIYYKNKKCKRYQDLYLKGYKKGWRIRQ